MLKTIALCAALMLVTTASAGAAEVPASAEQCQKMLDDISENAVQTKLPDDVMDKLDDLMNKAENQCQSGQFKDAVQTAEVIKEMVTQKN